MSEELTIIRRPAAPISPTMRDLLAVVFRQRRLALISFMAIFLAVLGYGVFAPSYKAHMNVLLRRERVDPLVTPAPTPSPMFQKDEITEEELNSQVELLRDDEILRTVVQVSGLSRMPWYERFLGGDEEARLTRAVRRMSRRLTVGPIRKTNLIQVTYSSPDPAQSAAVLHALAHAYLERQQRVRRPSGEYQFFEQQVTQARRGLLDAEFRLMDFSSDQGVVSAAQERDMALQKLSDAEGNDRQTQVAMIETRRRIQDLQSKLKSLPERTLTVIRNSDNPQLAEKMKSKLLELQLKRTELLTKFDPSYRLVQEVDQQIAETRTSIAGEEHSPLRDETTNQEPNHEWAKSELIKAQVELGALEAHGQATRIQVAGYREVAQRLGGNAIRQGELLGELKAAEEKYLLYMNKREEARIEDALDQGGILNVTITEQPRVPALPARAGWVFGLIGVMLGGTLSTSLAFAADYLAPGFRTPDEVVAHLGIPVLASLP
ncbi:MAG: GumC family protein [Terriglobales bacterium]